MRSKTCTAILLFGAAFLVVGCIRNGVLIEGSPTEAQRYAHMQDSLYTGNVEKFEEGKLTVQFSAGETLQGTYTGYRPKQGPHCTKSWFESLRADLITTVVPAFERGYVMLTGPSGADVHCFYGWTAPECRREGVCKSNDGRYFRLEF